MGYVVLILICLGAVGCGQHESHRKTFNLSGQDQSTQIISEPIQKLHLTILDNKVEDFIKILKDNNFSTHQQLPNGKTLLEEALFLKRIKIIRTLRSLGASDINLYLEGQPIREWIENNPEKDKLLRALDKTFEDDKIDLTLALASQNYQKIKTILDEEIDPNYFFETGETPLTESIKTKSMNAIRALLTSSNLNVNFLNIKGTSALWLARQLQLRSVINELIRRGAIEKEGEL